jgi:hypothetical protein
VCWRLCWILPSPLSSVSRSAPQCNSQHIRQHGACASRSPLQISRRFS